MMRDLDGRIDFARTLARLGDLPTHECVLDRLADALFDVDDVLGLLSREDAKAVRWIEPKLRTIYEEIDKVMQQICD